MSDSLPDSPTAQSSFQPQEPDPQVLKSLPKMSINQWLETLKNADRSFYNALALEVWSIAKTMDGLRPGFWSRFMSNRRLALEHFMQQRQREQGPIPQGDPTADSTPTAGTPHDPTA